ncbi:MAG: hypothetical protein N2235_02975 [Fischerella sp.]|nr:hypothetical protein [Fischerella sp.]
MTYTSGGLIERNDYNLLTWGTNAGGSYVTTPANLAVCLGVGSGRWGVGQSVSGISPVSIGQNVTAAQWATLVNEMNKMTLHQSNTSFTPNPSIVSGNIVTFYSQISTNITNVHTNMGSSFTLNSSTSSTASTTSNWGTSGNRRVTFTHTLTFSNGDAVRYFFNAGGQIRFTFSRTGGATNTRNTRWSELCGECGTVAIGYRNTNRLGGSGSTPTVQLNANDGGYWNQTYNTSKLHFRQFEDTAPYTANYIEINMTTSGTQGSNGDLGPVLTFTTHFVNVYAGGGNTAVDGTTSCVAQIFAPWTTYITNTWGTPTWGTPTASVN